MERSFLSATTGISAGYRFFDLQTKLRSDEGRAIGEDYFDRMTHVLAKGIKLTFILSDFDAVLAPDLHANSWKTRREFVTARKFVGPDADLTVTNAAHSARTGILPRFFLWPRLVKEVNKTAAKLNEMPSGGRARLLECSPSLRPMLRQDGNGGLRARRWPVPPVIPGTHHQKVCIIDRRGAFIGGLDLNEWRYDDKRKRSETWQDLQLMSSGPVAIDLHEFLDVVTGIKQPTAGGGRLLRTLSRRRTRVGIFLRPKPMVQTIADDHYHLIERARGLIYLEAQFLRDITLCGHLARAGRDHPSLSLIAVVPPRPKRWRSLTQPDRIRAMVNTCRQNVSACCPKRLATDLPYARPCGPRR